MRTVGGYFHQWRRAGDWERVRDALRRASRVQMNREPDPLAGVIDSQSAKAAQTTGTRNYDAGKKINGRKRQILLDTLGLRVFVAAHVASLQDRDGAKPVLQGAATKSTRLKKVWADGTGQLDCQPVRLEIGDRPTIGPSSGILPATAPLGRGTDAVLDFQLPPFERGL